MLRAFLAASLIAASSPALADEISAGDLTIDGAHIFKSFMNARAAGGYMTISNGGGEADLLLDVMADVPMIAIHESREEDGVMRMVHLDAVEIAPGETVSFRPGGLHVMVMGLGPDDLPVGDTLDVTLVFDRAGEVDVTFEVMERPEGGMQMTH